MVTIIKRTDLKSGFYSLRVKMAVAYVLIILLSLSLLSIYILSSVREHSYSNERVTMYTKANVVANMLIENNAFPKTLYTLEENINSLFAERPMRLMVLDEQTVVLYDNNETNNLEGKLFIEETVIKAFNGMEAYNVYKNEDSTHSMEVCVPITYNQDIIGVVYLRASLQSIDTYLNDIYSSLLTLSIIICILIAILSVFLSGIVSAPLVKLTHVAEEISNGNFNSHVAIHGRDEIARLSEALNTMTQKLSDLEDKRRHFVSDASHELKTPLAGIKLLSETILQTPDVDMETIKEFMSDINNEVDRLNRIIERLLDMAKIDSQKVKVELETVDLTKLIETIAYKLKPLAVKKNITLQYLHDTETQIEMLLDRDKIYEAIYNIADNSIKYTENGGNVTLKLSADINAVNIEIEDNGIGIPKEDAAMIFERFYRVDKARARDTGGTGLGLSIAQDAVSLHGGHIEVHSEEGVGSKFIIVLPFNGK